MKLVVVVVSNFQIFQKQFLLLLRKLQVRRKLKNVKLVVVVVNKRALVQQTEATLWSRQLDYTCRRRLPVLSNSYLVEDFHFYIFLFLFAFFILFPHLSHLDFSLFDGTKISCIILNIILVQGMACNLKHKKIYIKTLHYIQFQIFLNFM